MDLLQAWLVVGVPGLIVVGGLFVGRSRRRAWIGYAVLIALTLAFALIPGGAISAVLFGLLAVAFLATGRGTARDDQVPEHHEGRRRFTVAEPES